MTKRSPVNNSSSMRVKSTSHVTGQVQDLPAGVTFTPNPSQHSLRSTQSSATHKSIKMLSRSRRPTPLPPVEMVADVYAPGTKVNKVVNLGKPRKKSAESIPLKQSKPKESLLDFGSPSPNRVISWIQTNFIGDEEFASNKVRRWEDLSKPRIQVDDSFSGRGSSCSSGGDCEIDLSLQGIQLPNVQQQQRLSSAAPRKRQMDTLKLPEISQRSGTRSGLTTARTVSTDASHRSYSSASSVQSVPEEIDFPEESPRSILTDRTIPEEIFGSDDEDAAFSPRSDFDQRSNYTKGSTPQTDRRSDLEQRSSYSKASTHQTDRRSSMASARSVLSEIQSRRSSARSRASEDQSTHQTDRRSSMESARSVLSEIQSRRSSARSRASEDQSARSTPNRLLQGSRLSAASIISEQPMDSARSSRCSSRRSRSGSAVSSIASCNSGRSMRQSVASSRASRQ